MSTLINLWVMVLLLGSALVLQGIVIRRMHRSVLARLRARHAQQERTAIGHFEQAKRQIGQLQVALIAAQQQCKRRATVGAASTPSQPRTKEELHRTLDAATALRQCLPPEAFPDTLPSLHFPDDASLLLR